MSFVAKHSQRNFFPIAEMNGPLPHGGYVEKTPIWAVNDDSLLDASVSKSLRSRLAPLELGDKLAFMIDEVVSPVEANRIIDLTEQLGYRDEAPGISTPPGMRQNKTVHWVASAAILATLFGRLAPHLPPILDGKKLVPRLSQRINMYRYDENDIFNPHTDGDWPGYGVSTDGQSLVEWSGMRSKLTMLLYLNGQEDGIQGGETHLYDQGEIKQRITPKKGSALFFRHGRERSSVLHSGDRVLGQTSKYVARINVLYDL